MEILIFLEKMKQEIKFVTEVAELEPIVNNLSSKTELQTNNLATVPLLTEKAINFLKDFFRQKPDAKVLEFGSGSSTIWLSQFSKNLVSIEHDSNWHQKVKSNIAKNNDSNPVDLRLLPRPYHTVCEEFPDRFFDLIIVDGRDRVKCLEASIRILKKGGIIILDDAQGESYQKAYDLLQDWDFIRTIEPRPKVQKQTNWWEKPLQLELLESHDKIIFEVERLSRNKTNLLSGFAVDSPKAEIQYDANSIPIRGWVLGNNSRAVNVKVSCGERVLEETPVKNARPDVAKVYSQVPGAGKSGFATTVSLVGMPFDSELVIEAILEDGSCISIAKVRPDNQSIHLLDNSLVKQGKIDEAIAPSQKTKDKWILLHRKSTLKDFSQELKRIKSEELNSIIEGDNYSLFNFSEIHNLSKLSQNFSSSALELLEKNLRNWYRRQDEDARLKEFADKKQLSFISPYTGETVYNCKSLLINLEWVAYIFTCNNGIFYWVRHNASNGDFVYIPEIGAIIFDHNRLDNKQAASMVNNLKKYIIKNKEEFCTYIESEAETKLYTCIHHGRPFHYLFDRLGGLTYLESCGLLDKIDGFILKQSQNYFELTRLFPEISAKELINIECSDKEKELEYLQKIIYKNNGFVYFIRKLALENINPKYFLSAAESSTQEIEKVSSFIIRKPNFTVNTGGNIVDLIQSHHPLIWIGIAIEKRHWIEQVEGINSIINELSKEFPNIGVVIDGMTGADNQSLARSISKKLYNKENQICSEIMKNIPEEIGVYSTIGMNSRHKLFIAKSIDFFITQLGTQSLLPSFMAKKPGILHAIPGFRERRLYDPNTAILIDEQHIIPKESTETLAQGSRKDFQSYSLDWHIIYKAIKEQILPNLPNRAS